MNFGGSQWAGAGRAAATILVGVIYAALFAAPPPAGALEKEARRIDDSVHDAWLSGASCAVQYYNICTGWAWTWRDFGEGNRFGILVDPCCGSSSRLLQTFVGFAYNAPNGHGYTGTIGIYAADANSCPSGPAIASQPYVPDTPWTISNWSNLEVPTPFLVMFDLGDPYGQGLELTFWTDHPLAGPTGPVSCGVCFPSERVGRSFWYDRPESPRCPGQKFSDGLCDAEILMIAGFTCSPAGESSSMDGIQGLFR